MNRRLLLALTLGGLAVVVMVVIGLSQATTGGGDDQAAPSLAEQRAQLAGAPADLAALHAQAGELLPGDRADLRRRLAALQAAGRPVVINKWASWCGPCRLEFPTLARMGVKYGKRVAFLGLDSNDDADAARRFLKQSPVSYPSFEDRSTRLAQDLQAGRSFPTTVFIDAAGKRTVHQGPYNEDADLDQAIRRYALGA